MFKVSRIVCFIIITLTVLFFYLAFQQASHVHRDPHVLMTRYELLKKNNPRAAKRALRLILTQEPDYLPALRELSAIYLRDNKVKEALPLLIRLHQLEPQNHQCTLTLARIYYMQGYWQDATVLYRALQQHSNPGFQQESSLMLHNMSSSLPYYRQNAAISMLQQAQPPPPELPKTEQTLLSYFYKLKTEEPLAAARFMRVLNVLMPDNPLVYEEQGYLALQKHEQQSALDNFLEAYRLRPSARLALQLAYLYYERKDNEDAADYFLIAATAKEADIHEPAVKGYSYLQALAVLEKNNTKSVLPPMSILSATAPRENILLDQFYALKKRNKQAAWSLIRRITAEFPNNLLALREAGYLAIELDKKVAAIDFFTHAYILKQTPELAMQLAYLYSLINQNYYAYQYFKLATESPDNELSLRAQNAMTNLVGLQTKALPEPYFAEIFFTPFTQSRFGLTVRPIIMRLGLELDNYFNTRAYLFVRQTDDNKSSNLGQIPQIYEDNVRILGTGVQATPIASIPLIAFVEAGGAYDLFYRNRARWRGDLRGGLMYYNEFGAKPAYFANLRIAADYYSTVYGDVTYFSRFNNNVIGTLKTHQGIHLLQYHSSIINFYLSGRILEDTNRDFFNNIGEIGPGIGIIPSNRFRLELRLEHINGVYLPAGGSFNPYGKYYTNKVAQLLFYARI